MDISPCDYCCEVHEDDISQDSSSESHEDVQSVECNNFDSTCEEAECDFSQRNGSTEHSSEADIGLEGSASIVQPVGMHHLQEDIFRESDVGTEDLRRIDGVAPAISQRTEFFEFSP